MLIKSSAFPLTIIIVILFPTPALFATDPLSFFAPSERIEGIGVDRIDLRLDQLNFRVREMLDTQTFAIMRDPEAVSGAARIFSPELQRLFREAERECQLPQGLLQKIAYLESWGKSHAKSGSGAVGIMQYIAETAQRDGLFVGWKKIRVPTGERRVRLRSGRMVKKPVLSTRLVFVDERLDPAKAIPAAARHLRRSYETFGSWDFSIAEYHMGKRGVLNLLSLVTGEEASEAKAREIIARRNLTYPKVFFDASPAHNEKVYRYLQSRKDYSATYYFRVVRSGELLELYQKDRGAFLALAESFKNKTKPKEKAKSRAYIHYTYDHASAFSTPQDIEAALISGRLARMPDDPEFFGIKIGRDNGSPTGDGDLQSREIYEVAEPATIGMAIYIAYEMRRLEGKGFEPLEANSLAHLLWGQQRLVQFHKNTNARIDLSLHLHTLGKAIDFPLKHMDGKRADCLRFILEELQSLGLLSYERDGESRQTLHVVPTPRGVPFFERVYAGAAQEHYKKLTRLSGRSGAIDEEGPRPLFSHGRGIRS